MKNLIAESRLMLLTLAVVFFILEGTAFATPLSQTGAMSTLKVPACPSKPEVFTDLVERTPELPPHGQLLVGRTVNLWIESNVPGGLKLWVRHDFKTGRKEFVCANIPGAVEENFSLPILALYDLSETGKVGDAIWQLQVMVRDRELGLWSQKSGLLTKASVFHPSNQARWFSDITGEKQLLTENRTGAYKISSVVEFDPAN